MTLTDSSPFLVFITVPSTPTQSPRSRSSKAAWLLVADHRLRDEQLDRAGAVAAASRT